MENPNFRAIFESLRTWDQKSFKKKFALSIENSKLQISSLIFIEQILNKKIEFPSYNRLDIRS